MWKGWQKMAICQNIFSGSHFRGRDEAKGFQKKKGQKEEWKKVKRRRAFPIFLNWAIPGLFLFIFAFSIELTVNVQYKFLPMTGFKPGTSEMGSDHSTNWATTTAQWAFPILLQVSSHVQQQQHQLKQKQEQLVCFVIRNASIQNATSGQIWRQLFAKRKTSIITRALESFDLNVNSSSMKRRPIWGNVRRQLLPKSPMWPDWGSFWMVFVGQESSVTRLGLFEWSLVTNSQRKVAQIFGKL